MPDGASQPGHGFTRGRAVRFDGDRWTSAAPGDAGIRIVSAFVDTSNFELAAPGEVLDGFTGLEPGATYYLTAAGGMSTTASDTKLGTAYSAQQLAVEVEDVSSSETVAVLPVPPSSPAADAAITRATVLGMLNDSTEIDFVPDAVSGVFSAILVATGVVAASYGAAASTLTAIVDSKGRLSALAAVPIAILANQVTNGDATWVNVSGDTLTGTLNARDILPTADNLYDLGSPIFRWNDLNLGGALTGATATFTGNVGVGTTTPAARFVVANVTGGNGIEFVPLTGGAALIEFYNRGTAAYYPARYLASAHSFELGNVTVGGHVLSSVDNTYDLGSLVAGWRNLFMSASGTGGTTDGQLWADSTQGALAGYLSGVKLMHESVIFTVTASKTVANTLVETSLIGNGVGTKTTPADFWKAGKTIRLRICGVMSDTGTPTLNIKAKMGATTLVQTGVIALGGTISNNAFVVDLTITCQLAGPAGVFFTSGLFQYDESVHAGTTEGMASASGVVIDTTLAQAIDVTATWGTASASNTITSQTCTIEVLN